MLQGQYVKAQEALQNVDSCRDDCQLFGITKQKPGEKRDFVGVSCLKDESGAVKVSWMIEIKSGRSIWKR